MAKILANILLIGRQRPVIIQSLFPAIHGEEPPVEEIREYGLRLKELKAGGAHLNIQHQRLRVKTEVHPESCVLP